MSVISGIGLSSGIDYDSLISGILELERQPINRLEEKQSDYNETISAYSQLSSKVSALKDAADNLRTVSSFFVKTGSVSDETVLGVSVSNSASAGNYDISITQLAQAHKITHQTGLSDKDTTTVLQTGQKFEFTINGESQSITASSDMTLDDLATAINDLTYTGDVKVEATVVNTGTATSPSYKLILTSNTTGADYGITVTLDESVLDMKNNPVELKAAQDAIFTVDTLQITRSSNTVSDVLDGVTFTLKKGSSSATITVSNDTESIVGNIQNFVDAYNDLVNYVSQNSTYDTQTNTGGPLNGESTAKNIINHLRSIITSRVSGLPEDLRALSQIGVSTNRDGTLSLDTTTLNEKLSSDIEGVADIFTDSTNGIGVRIYDYTDDVTDAYDGSIHIRVSGLQSRVEDISDDISDLEAKLERMEEDLRRQFAALESLLAGLSAQSSFLGGLTGLWNNS